MDPNEGAFQTARYNYAEIWPFPVNGGGETGLDLRRMQFGQSLGLFAENVVSEVSGDEPMMVTDQGRARSKKRRDPAPAPATEDESVKAVSTANGGMMFRLAHASINAGTLEDDCDLKRVKMGGSGNDNLDSKPEAEANASNPAEQNTKPPEPPKQDYIHVRARRGQATDSHSLAERARREKISERMKILQDLVPGCNKVIGKALVLDEIINYIQSLQRQVEFLSMKLEAVNSRMDPGPERFPTKDFGQQTFDTAGAAFGSQAPREYERSSSPEWLHMQIGGSFERTT